MNESLAENLAAVQARVTAACSRCGRSPSDVTVVAVGKRQPIESLQEVRAAGQAIFGESQVQEAEAKAASISGAEWHLIGPLQSNKARRAARLFDVVHSVDRLKVAKILNSEAATLGRQIDIFVQLNLGAEESKHGFPLGSLEEALSCLAELPALRPIGLMAIPPFEAEPSASRGWFRQLREHRDRVLRWPGWGAFPGCLSMGMSRDFEIAIEEGATHVRVGTGIFGARAR